jgi:predicted RNA binding protein YcfA (HicA-like mRNA interferase family)
VTRVIDPRVLIELLKKAGWVIVGERKGSYVRLNPPLYHGRGWSMIVPLNSAASDFKDLMDAANQVLRNIYHIEEWQ